MTLLKSTSGPWNDGSHRSFQPFSLALALDGERVVTRDGRTVQEIRLFTLADNWPVVACIGGHLFRFEKDGTSADPEMNLQMGSDV